MKNVCAGSSVWCKYVENLRTKYIFYSNPYACTTTKYLPVCDDVARKNPLVSVYLGSRLCKVLFLGGMKDCYFALLWRRWFGMNKPELTHLCCCVKTCQVLI
uniref:Uncharacterized protein n=1 Tax=Anguilla anguilla TaxID=7936 RepID=A0A0E9Q171_ANGAN